jgi:hypothetical protein
MHLLVYVLVFSPALHVSRKWNVISVLQCTQSGSMIVRTYLAMSWVLQDVDKLDVAASTWVEVVSGILIHSFDICMSCPSSTKSRLCICRGGLTSW